MQLKRFPDDESRTAPHRTAHTHTHTHTQDELLNLSSFSHYYYYSLLMRSLFTYSWLTYRSNRLCHNTRTDAFGGGSADWARSVAKIRYSYLIELRDRHGFQLPVDQVIPTGRESWAAVRELAAHVLFNDGFTRPCRDQLRHHYRRREPDTRLLCSVDGDEATSSAVHEALVDDDQKTSSNNGCHRRTVISGELIFITTLFAMMLV